MTRFYYVDRETKRIFVFDTNPTSISFEYLGQSDHPNIRAQAGMFLRDQIGFRILSNPTDLG